MKSAGFLWGACCVLSGLLVGACDKTGVGETEQEGGQQPLITLEEVARVLSTVPLQAAQVGEVRDAALSSAGNGYDEEYLMRNLFSAPGSGVGESDETKAGRYERPLRDLLEEAVKERFSTKAGGPDADTWLEALAGSDVQIYWPSPEDWDGSSLPVITYDPGDGALSNEGYELQRDGSVKKVMVDESTTRTRPVWVVNRNSDAEYRSLEMLRREDPSWGSGGGGLIVGPTKAGADVRTLVLRSFKAHRQYDSWFSGGSEFFVKMGAVEDFRATSEADILQYKPSITDFMIVVRRSEVGKELPFNAVLVSEWTGQLTSSAFMLIEDDGGTRTTWKCNATLKYNSKSYGFDLEIPLNSRDDIVWRGALSQAFIEKNSGIPCRFGDVELVLEFI